MDQADFATLRQHIARAIEADLAREEAEAEALKARLLPRLQEAVVHARREQLCGRAWLFGSFAWGRPTESSDVDVLAEACPDPDALTAVLWRALDRAVHVVRAETAPSSLVQRACAEGQAL
ncbi:MAG TPA: nucleotidyltransferase domain-containing protein [Polyangiaceae bacterium]|nr:nucleotidyltransferase domain-containing protein [Polyangiaceae bacterium]